jgi:hypothetical protein
MFECYYAVTFLTPWKTVVDILRSSATLRLTRYHYRSVASCSVQPDIALCHPVEAPIRGSAKARPRSVSNCSGILACNGSDIQHCRFRKRSSERNNVRRQTRADGHRKLRRYFGNRLTQYAITDFIHRSNPIVAQNQDRLWQRPLLLYTYGGSRKRDGWDRAFYPLVASVVTMIIMGYIAVVTGNKYVRSFHVAIPFILYEIRGMQKSV